MSSEISDLKAYVKEIRDDLKVNTELTRQGFEKMNGRVKKLEVERARREGRESVTNATQLDWKKVSGSLLGIISAALALAYIIIDKVIK